jgi:hypothetical protein
MQTDFKKDLDTYFYDAQLRGYIIQFMAIFSGLKVRVGKNSNVDSSNDFVDVPVRYGNSSRIVDAILTENTQNKPLSLPIMSVNMAGIDIATHRLKGIGTQTRASVLPLGGSLPDDLKVVYKQQPVPYDGMMELSIYTSNEHEHFQILEQILMIFDPTLQIQTSDDIHDFIRITQVELKSIDFATNYPKLADKRVIVTSLNFLVWFYLAPPVNIKTNFIKAVKLRLEAIRQTEDVYEKVSEVNRTDPPYKVLFDIDDMNIPPN